MRLGVCLIVCALCTQASVVWAQPVAVAKAPKTALERALDDGRYDSARELALRHDDVASLDARVTFALLDGDFKRAEAFAQAALKKSVRPQDKIRAHIMMGRVLRERGDWVDAQRSFRAALTLNNNAHEARYRLGEALWQTGKVIEARAVIDGFTPLFNNGVLVEADDLMHLGLSMQIIERFDDANYAFKQANEKDPRNVDVLSAWGHLLLQKYNMREALASFEDALKINANHPEALIGMAQVEMMRSNSGDKTREFIERARAQAPKHPELLLTHAHLSIRDSNCEDARKDARSVLALRPKHLEALTVEAICHYLDDDLKAYEAAKDKALKLSPKYALVLSMTADYGIRAHRYIEAMALYREALKIDPEHAAALLGLGMGLSRIGKEDEAVEYLKRAADVDPYNQRAYYMVELYEKVMPGYEFTLYKNFKVRARQDQREMINLFVAPVVEEALQTFTRKYKTSPWKDLAVEIYPETTTFSVRSVGLPNISPHGICFGKVVTVRSPSDGNFNWKQVVWHELAHTYHLFVSKSRVPRWFTEGLAEYETNVYDPAWSRHHDEEIAIKLQKGEIPSVLKLDRGFTHAKTRGEILRSYHLASLAIHFIAETFGFDSVVGMLEAWGEQKDTTAVILDTLKVSIEEFDAKFMVWLNARYMTFANQLLFDIETIPTNAELKRKLARNALDAQAWAQSAVNYAAEGKVKEMDEALTKALKISPSDLYVNQIGLILRSEQGRSRDVLEHGEVILNANKDSYSIRMALGNAAMQSDDIIAARVHFDAAVAQYPTGVEGWSMLARLGKNTKNDALFKMGISKMYRLNQNDPVVARLYVTQLEEIGESAMAFDAAQRWVQINPFDTEAQRATLKLSLVNKDYVRAQQSWDALLLLNKSEREETYLDAVKTLERLGKKAEAAAYRERAKKDGVTIP